jgi:ribosomal protein L40E
MNKKTILTSLLISFTSIATASHGESGGLFGLLTQIPLPTENWRQLVASASAFGLMWFAVYLIIKKLVNKFGLQSLFNMGGSSSTIGSSGGSSRNLGAILSLLIVIVMMTGAHTYFNVLMTIQQVLLLALVFGIVALVIAVVGGGSAGVLASVGASGKALAWGGGKAKDGLDKAGVSSAAKRGVNGAKKYASSAKSVFGANKYVNQAGNKYASAANSLGFKVCSNCYKLNPQSAKTCNGSGCSNSL